MKKSALLISLACSLNAFAVSAPALKGKVQIEEDMISSWGLPRGIGMVSIPVSVEASATGGEILVKGFNSEVVCLEHGEPEIPRHPETAPCLRSEKRWTPELVLNAHSSRVVLAVGEKARSVDVGREFSLPTSCLKNLSDLVVVSPTRPAALPVPALVKSDCLASASGRVEGKFNLEVLNNNDIEAIVDLTLDLGVSARGEIEVRDGEGAAVEVVSARLRNTGLADFGGFGPGAMFRYYARVELK